METQNTDTKKQKADIDLKIELPNLEKPFFNKPSTENNMISQLKKAGTKLGEDQKLNVSVNGTAISLTKAETQSITLSSDVRQKLNPERETSKGVEPTDAKDLEIKDYSVQSQDGNKKNLEYLKNQIKFLGFGEDASLHKDLKDMVEKDIKDFSITTSSDKTSFQNKVSFDLHFSRSKDTNNVFFNKFDATLTNAKTNVDLQHTFAVKNNGFTAKEAINLLEGRSVKTELTKPNSQEKEVAFVKLKLNDEKNENGNFKLQVYNKNYGIDTQKIVDKSNLFFKDEKHKEITIKSLEKGNIVKVTMKDNGKETEGKAILNPQYKMLNLYDLQMKRLNTNAPVLDETQNVDKEVKKQHHLSR